MEGAAEMDGLKRIVAVPENRLQESAHPSTPRAYRKGAGETAFPIPKTPGGEKRPVPSPYSTSPPNFSLGLRLGGRKLTRKLQVLNIIHMALSIRSIGLKQYLS